MPRRRTPKRGDTAKVFWSGRSQAIRLPQKYRLSCREVTIHRHGSALVLQPSAEAVDSNGWPLSLWRVLGTLDEDFDVGDRRRPHERGSPLR